MSAGGAGMDGRGAGHDRTESSSRRRDRALGDLARTESSSSTDDGVRHIALTQYRSVVRKDALQTLRDRRIVFLLVAAPLIQTILFGFAVDFDVDRVPTAVADLDGSAASRAHVQRLLADGTLRQVAVARSALEADALVDDGRAAAALVVPPGFGDALSVGHTARVQVIVDGTDPLRASAAASAASRYFAGAAAEIAAARRPLSASVRTESNPAVPPASRTENGSTGLTGSSSITLDAAGRNVAPVIDVVPRVLFNASLRTAVYIVPGILAMLLVVVTTIVTAMGLAREREVGTLEQVLVTPIRPFVLLAGKMTPFVAIGLFDVLLVLTASAWIFAVPVRGPLAVLGAGTVLYLCSTLGVGLLISTMASSQQQGFLGGFLFILPAVLLSGIMTPIAAMPAWLRAVTWLNPLRFFAELVRAVLLRGAGIADVWVQLVVLGVYGAAILGAATLRFRRRLG